MKPLSRRAFEVGIAAVAAFATLTACSGGGSGAGSTSDKIEGTITFQTWNLKNDKYTPYFNSLISTYQKKHPGTTIKWVDQPAEGYQQKLSADAAAGSLPDVVDMGPDAAYTLAKAGVALDVAKDASKAKSNYLPKAWQAMTFKAIDGGTYAFPWYLNTGPSFYNGDLLTKCGVSADSLPKSYDDLFSAAGTFTKKCPDDTWFARTPVIETFGEYGVGLMNSDHTKFTFNSAKGIELVDKYAALYKAKGLDADALNKLQTAEVTDFKAGTLAYLPGSSYTLNDLKQTAPKVYKNVKIGSHIYNSSPNMYIESLVVNSQTKKKALALDFAQFVTNSTNQLEFAKKASVFPSSAGSLDDSYFTKTSKDPGQQLLVETAKTVKNATVWWPPEFDSTDADYLKDQIAQALLGKVSSKQALDSTVSYANNRLATGGK